jgi:hypothetical protein
MLRHVIVAERELLLYPVYTVPVPEFASKKTSSELDGTEAPPDPFVEVLQ